MNKSALHCMSGTLCISILCIFSLRQTSPILKMKLWSFLFCRKKLILSVSLKETYPNWVTIPACGQKNIYFSFSQQILSVKASNNVFSPPPKRLPLKETYRLALWNLSSVMLSIHSQKWVTVLTYICVYYWIRECQELLFSTAMCHSCILHCKQGTLWAFWG